MEGGRGGGRQEGGKKGGGRRGREGGMLGSSTPHFTVHIALYIPHSVVPHPTLTHLGFWHCRKKHARTHTHTTVNIFQHSPTQTQNHQQFSRTTPHTVTPYSHMQARMHARMHTHMHACTHVNMHIYMYTHTYGQPHMCMYCTCTGADLFLSSESQNLASSSGERAEAFAPSVTALLLTKRVQAYRRGRGKERVKRERLRG